MTNLQQFNAKVCYTACGHLIVDDRILLIKHKKLQSWMSPGGHIDENELPHQAAEREFFEETGLQVKAISTDPLNIAYAEAEILPQPMLVNLHWVSKKNYDLRSFQSNSTDSTWKKGCEQHLGFVYLMEPLGDLDFSQNIEETDGIAWFSLKELQDIEMLDNVRQEIEHVFNKLNLI